MKYKPTEIKIACEDWLQSRRTPIDKTYMALSHPAESDSVSESPIDSEPGSYAAHAILISLYCGVGVVGVTANVALLFATCSSHARLTRRSVTGLGSSGASGGAYIHFGVAGFDLAFLLVNLPMQLFNYLYYDRWAVDYVAIGDGFSVEDHYQSASCKAFHYIPTVVYGAHVLFLVGLGIQRLHVAVYPLSAAARHSSGLILATVALSVALALVMAAPQLVVSGTRTREFTPMTFNNSSGFAVVYQCGELWTNTSDRDSREMAFRIYVQAAYVWVPMALVQLCYGILLLRLGRRVAAIGVARVSIENVRGNKADKTTNAMFPADRFSRNFRLNLTVGLTTAVFFVCWTPFSIANLVSDASDPVREYLRLFGYCSAALNPCVYAFLNPAPRAELESLTAGLAQRFSKLAHSFRCCVKHLEGSGSDSAESRSDPPQQAQQRIVSRGGNEASKRGAIGYNSSSFEFKQQLKRQMQQQQLQRQQQQQQQQQQRQQPEAAGQEQLDQRPVIIRRDTRSTRVGGPGG